MDPYVKLWWYHSWVNKINSELEIYKSASILVGSFSNPEMAQKMSKKDNPDVEVSDKEFDDSFEVVKKSIEEEKARKNIKHRRKRKLIKE